MNSPELKHVPVKTKSPEEESKSLKTVLGRTRINLIIAFLNRVRIRHLDKIFWGLVILSVLYFTSFYIPIISVSGIDVGCNMIFLRGKIEVVGAFLFGIFLSQKIKKE